MKEMIYRGSVRRITKQGVLVGQLEGFGYGQDEILFRLTPETQISPENAPPQVGNFVEAVYNGVLTRSLPGQATALAFHVIAPFSDSIVVNGEVQKVQKVGEYYQIDVIPLSLLQNNPNRESLAGFENHIILNAAPQDFEQIDLSQLAAGVCVSAITRGIATNSLPPQMPVYRVLPYTQ